MPDSRQDLNNALWARAVRGTTEAIPDFFSGAMYSPTEPAPEDASGAYKTGALLSAGLPFAALRSKYGPLIEELNSIIKDTPEPNAIQQALLSRVTPSKVFPKQPINLPEGLMVPPHLNSQFSGRPQVMIDRFQAQQRIPGMEAELPNMRLAKSTTSKMLAKHEAPSVTSIEDLPVSASKPQPDTQGGRKPLSRIRTSGNVPRGPASTAKIERAALIKAHLDLGTPTSEIATKFGVSTETVMDIKRGAAWANVKPATLGDK